MIFPASVPFGPAPRAVAVAAAAAEYRNEEN